MNNEIQEKITAQRKFCKTNESLKCFDYEPFAPNDGVCYNCRKQIYDKITLESASKFLVTGCPHCHRSYCE